MLQKGEAHIPCLAYSRLTNPSISVELVSLTHFWGLLLGSATSFFLDDFPLSSVEHCVGRQAPLIGYVYVYWFLFIHRTVFFIVCPFVYLSYKPPFTISHTIHSQPKEKKNIITPTD